jgi:hypothetical protein
VIAVVVALAAAGAIAATRLSTDAGTDTLVDEDSPEFAATERFRQAFGDDAAVVLVREDLQRLVLTRDIRPLFELETCLAGGTPEGESLPRNPNAALPEVCDEIARLAPGQVVYGPATFLYESVAQIRRGLRSQIGSADEEARAAARAARRQAAEQGLSEAEQDRAARQASAAVLEAFQGSLLAFAVQYGLSDVPRLDDPQFVSQVVFDSSKAPGTPKERCKYLFPGPDSALISVRLRPDLSDDERHHALELFRRAAADPRFQLSQGDYVVSGIPAVVDGLAEALRSELLVLLATAVVVMALVLLGVLPAPLRLLPLGVALAAAALTFGLLAALGGSLTMASIAVLPVLIGLAVDYAIQFQARFSEARAEGLAPGRAVVASAGAGGPVIGTACLATAAGFAALALSPIPMVRSFGLLLVAGVALAFCVALTGGLAALALAGWRGGTRAGRGTPAIARVPHAGSWPPRSCSRSAAGSRPPGRASSPTSATSPPRACRRCATSTPCRRRPASPARSTSWFGRTT